MACHSTQTMAEFLQSYAPERFDWESPGFCGGSKFLWTHQLRLRSRTQHSPRKRTSTADSDSSPLLDMSISLEDTKPGFTGTVNRPLSIASGSQSSTREFSRKASATCTDSSLSNMSISLFGDGFTSISSDFEDFASNIPARMHAIQERMTGTHSFDTSLSLLKSRECLKNLSLLSDMSAYVNDEQNEDSEEDAFYYDIVLWIESLFIDVAQCFINSEESSNRRNICWSNVYSEEPNDRLQAATQDIFEIHDGPVVPIVKLPAGTREPRLPALRTIDMLPEDDYEAINPEQVSFMAIHKYRNTDRIFFSSVLPLKMSACGAAG